MTRKKNLAIKIFTVAAMLLSTSCATIISGSRQTIKISSNPSSATVYINEVEVGKTPLEKTLKTNQEYEVVLKLDGYKPYQTNITKKFNAWTIGNIVIGGLIGIIVDAATGSVYRLAPKELDAVLSQGTAFKRRGKNLYIAISMNIDPKWEKIGQLTKVD